MTAIVARRIVTSRSLPVLLFVIAGLSLDITFGSDELRIGNFVLLACCAGAVALTLATGRLRARPRLNIADGIYLTYLGFIALSGIWAPSAIDTAVQVMLLFVIWLTSLCLSREHISTVVRYVVHVAFWASLLGFLMTQISPVTAYQPSLYGYTTELRGIFAHQLRNGMYAALALGFLVLAKLNGELHFIFRRRLVFYLFTIVIFVDLVLAQARLYTFFTAIALVFVIVLPRAAWARILVAVTIVAGLMLLMQSQSSLIAGLSNEGVDVTLTGRTTIWEKTSVVADRSPIWGHGYPSFDSSTFDWMWGGKYRPAHPHNSYLQAYFETGLIGFVLTLAFVIMQFWTSLRHSGIDRRHSYTLFIVTATILNSLTGANYAAKPSALFVYVMLAFAIDSRRGSMVMFSTRAKAQIAVTPPSVRQVTA